MCCNTFDVNWTRVEIEMFICLVKKEAFLLEEIGMASLTIRRKDKEGNTPGYSNVEFTM